MHPTAATPSRPARRSRGRRLAGVLLAACTGAAALAGPAAAHPLDALPPTLPTDLTHSATDNVDYLGRFPEHTGTAGGAPSEDGRLFYLTDPRGVHVYDTTDPASPTLLDSLSLYQQQLGAALAQEDPDTDGRILLVDGSTTPVGTAQLHVVDVSDPGDLSVLSTVPVTDHTWTCVTQGENGCAYAYGRTGHVVDLRDPAKPVLLPTTWRQAVGHGNRSNSPYTHDLTEIAPGLVMSAGASNVLMDTRDPAKPVLLNLMQQPGRFSSLGYHSVEWARGGRDDVLVVGTEIAPSGATNTAGSDCEGAESVIETWDAKAVRGAVEAYFAGRASAEDVRAERFERIDSFSVSGRGLFLDGAAPAHVLYCAHWMEQHPDFKDGGLLAVSYYDRGTRFLEVGKDGKMSERGWMVAAEGYSGSVQWVPGPAAKGKAESGDDGDIAYVMDYRRGLEVLRLGLGEATGVDQLSPDLIASSSTRALLDAGVPASSRALQVGGPAALLLLVANVVLLRRRRVLATA